MKYLICFVLITANCFVSFSQKTITFGKGYIEGVTVNASSNASSGLQTLKSTGFLPNPKSSSRFLSQATFGPSYPEIASLQITGIEPWLNTQLSLPNSFNITNYVGNIHKYMVDSLNAKGVGGPYTIDNLFINDYTFDIAWFQGAMTSPDKLRWRVGMALSQIFVTSRLSAFDNNPYALASYYDLLNKNAFGNYRSLIDSVTYHPTMGVYLTFMNNHATDTLGTNRVFPDENYAREVMQLFSIGLYELNDDGSEKKDSQGNSIPTYNNDDIANLAKVFTGLSWSESKYLGQRATNDRSYTKRMKFFGLDSTEAITKPWKTSPRIVNGHEPGAKYFLKSSVPSRPVAQGELDIKDALDIIFNHPNVPPFISKKLIQHLVTSNPSPDFVKRISEVFKNNGSNVRGDLKATIRAILLDPEARACCATKDQDTYGHFREPFLRYMNLVKGMELTATTGVYRNVMEDLYDKLEQRPLSSPSVFNFYQSSYVPDGPLSEKGKVGPEFQMLNSLSLANYMNALHRWIVDNSPIQYYGLFSGERYKSALDPEFNYVKDYQLAKDERLGEFLDKYNLVLAQGRISKHNIQTIKNTLLSLPITVDANGNPDPGWAERRLKMGLYLIMISPEYMITK